MKKMAMAGAVTVLLGGASLLRAAEAPQMPQPTKQHRWLQRFVGTWESKVKVYMEPGKPPMTMKSSERYRMVGGFWVVGEGQSQTMGEKYSSILTVGYDPAKKKYIGSWIDSGTSYQWNYLGSVDASGKTLTLETTGPCPMKPGLMVKFREVTSFKGPDHKTFTSSMQDEKGKWMTLLTIESWRKNEE